MYYVFIDRIDYGYWVTSDYMRDDYGASCTLPSNEVLDRELKEFYQDKDKKIMVDNFNFDEIPINEKKRKKYFEENIEKKGVLL